MANYNTILIKRRVGGEAGAPGSLSGGELAFNEAGEGVLYYGSASGVIAIGGAGAFVDRTTAQNVSGVKTFVDGLKITSAVAADDDATTKLYVDTEVDTLSSALQSQIDLLDSGTTTAVDNLSTEIYNGFVKLTDDRAVTLNGGLTVTGDGSVDNLTVTGNLSVLGTQVVVNTETINISGTSTQIDVINNGTGTGLTVSQTGDQDVAEFKDDGATALIIKDGGNVGIGTATPNEKLTVAGNISATGTLEVGSGATATFYVGTDKVGIGTEAPNEELTVVGSISATEDLFARDGSFNSLTVVTDISGTADSSYLVNFIIDGGTF